MAEKLFQFLFLIKELCRVGHEDQKFDLLCILNYLLVVLIILFHQLNFFFYHRKGVFFVWLLFDCFLLSINFYPM